MNTTDVLRAAHQELRRAVPGARRKAAKDEGPLATAFREAMRAWDQQKAGGVSFTDRLKGLDGLIRQVWPFTREWKYVCTSCDDLGAVWSDCSGDATCGRRNRHLPHTFVSPCWCGLGVKFQDAPKASTDDFTAAGKSRSRTMSRMGR